MHFSNTPNRCLKPPRPVYFSPYRKPTDQRSLARSRRPNASAANNNKKVLGVLMIDAKLKPLSLAVWFSVTGCALTVGAVQAAEFDTGNPDWTARWDNTVRYNLGIRAEGRDSALANNASYDESDAKFDRGDVVTNRVDVMSEMEVAYKQYNGFRISGAGWYDQAYENTDVETSPGNVYYPGAFPGTSTPSYNNGKYSSFTKRYHRGPSGELLGRLCVYPLRSRRDSGQRACRPAYRVLGQRPADCRACGVLLASTVGWAQGGEQPRYRDP